MELMDLIQKRANLVDDARRIVDRIDQEKRAWTQEEQNEYDKIMNDVATMGEDIARRQQLQAIQNKLNQPVNEPIKPNPGVSGKARSPLATDEYRSAFSAYLRNHVAGLTAGEVKALQAGQDDLGGYLKAPIQMVQELLKAADDQVFVRRYARTFQTTDAESLGAPAMETDVADWDWTTELATGSEGDIGFGKRELKANPLAKRVKVSRTLLRKAVMSPEQIVRERLAYKLGITQEKAYLTGSGVGQPLGVFTASNMGISTARDVSKDNTTAAITFDGLKEAKYALKQAYWAAARWLFHTDAVKMLAKIKDGTTGQYIWEQSVVANEPDRLMGFPVDMSTFAPNTFAASQYVGLLANWREGYWIQDSLSMEIQRLVELYAEQNQIGFIGRYEGDGMPVKEEAFVRVTLASA